MAEEKSINAAELTLLGLHIRDIAEACEAMRVLAIKIISNTRNPLPAQSVEVFAQKGGWLADECLRILGETPFNETWEDWALSPAAKEALNALNVAPVASQAADGGAPR